MATKKVRPFQDHYFISSPQSSGSGSTSQRYVSESGSGSFYRYHQAKIVRKTLIFTVLWLLLDFLSLKNDVNVPSKSNKQVNDENNKIQIRIQIRIHLSEAWIRGSGSTPKCHGSGTLLAPPLSVSFGSGIRDGKKSGSTWFGIQDKHPGSEMLHIIAMPANRLFHWLKNYVSVTGNLE